MGPGLPEGHSFVPWTEGGMGLRRARARTVGTTARPRNAGRASEEGKRSGGGVSTPETAEAPASPRVRAAGPGPARGKFLTRTVIAVHGEGVRPLLVRDVVARDVGDRQRLLPRAHPVVLVQFELFFLHLENQTMSWRFLGLLRRAVRRPLNARGCPARPLPGSRGPGVQLQPSTHPHRGPAAVLRGSRGGCSAQSLPRQLTAKGSK